MGLLKNKLRIGKPEEKKALRLKPETVELHGIDRLVAELKDASLLGRLNAKPEPRIKEKCHVGCPCVPCRRGDCNYNVRVCEGSGGGAFGLGWGRR